MLCNRPAVDGTTTVMRTARICPDAAAQCMHKLPLCQAAYPETVQQLRTKCGHRHKPGVPCKGSCSQGLCAEQDQHSSNHKLVRDWVQKGAKRRGRILRTHILKTSATCEPE